MNQIQRGNSSIITKFIYIFLSIIIRKHWVSNSSPKTTRRFTRNLVSTIQPDTVQPLLTFRLLNSYLPAVLRGLFVVFFCEVYSTKCSQGVSHPSTNLAQRSLTSVIGREPVLSAWYDRKPERNERKLKVFFKLSFPPSRLNWRMLSFTVAWLGHEPSKPNPP